MSAGGTLGLCEKYFKTRDVYELFELEKKSALPRDIKKSYYKLSLQYHPDRVSESEKEEATEKFKLLSKLYQVLSDEQKKALYDEQGIIDDDDEDLEGRFKSWVDMWKNLFKPLTTEDIVNYEKEYIDSDLEKKDIKEAYLRGKGCINYMMQSVPFMKVEDEPRIQKIVKEMIDKEEVPEFKVFTNEPAAKRKRRHKKYAREEKEADELKKELGASSSLQKALMERQQSREKGFNSLMDKLMEKYGDLDDSEPVEFDKILKVKKGKNAKPKAKQGLDESLKTVKSGKVRKSK